VWRRSPSPRSSTEPAADRGHPARLAICRHETRRQRPRIVFDILQGADKLERLLDGVAAVELAVDLPRTERLGVLQAAGYVSRDRG
jgi:hypothetical protein